MSLRPYHELALVPSIQEPAPLWAWHNLHNEPCPKCRYTRGKTWTEYSVVTAMVVTRRAPPILRASKLCVGCTRFWPFRKACLETREHFHVQCRMCGWSILMATADQFRSGKMTELTATADQFRSGQNDGEGNSW